VKTLPLENEVVKRAWVAILVTRLWAFSDGNFDCYRELFQRNSILVMG
jgi:hypothetical protein